jgi:putative sigma-54 modulation protein
LSPVELLGWDHSPGDFRYPSWRLATVQVKVSARHGHLSEEHQKEISQKAEKLLHYFERITMIEVTVDLGDRIHKKAEIKVDAEHKHDFVAIDESENVMVAVDLAIDRIKHQITKYKEKITNHHR